jgi:hypothetical protein
MWRPLGWSWRDINQQKSTIAEVPEVQEFKEREEWQELVNDAAALDEARQEEGGDVGVEGAGGVRGRGWEEEEEEEGAFRSLQTSSSEQGGGGPGLFD